MEMLPDYPDRIVAEHAIRVERATLLGSMVLISIGAWWLLGSIESQSDSVIRIAPVLILFSSSFLLSDLAEFGSSGRFRIATSCSISWPPLLAIIESQRTTGGNPGALLILASVSIFLFLYSRKILSSSISSRRWRGITSSVGLGIAAAIILGSSDPISWAIVIIPTISFIVPDFFIRDQSSGEKRRFSMELKRAEGEILRLQSKTPGMQQPASIIKIAREEGWRDPAKGLEMINEAEREASRIEVLSQDIKELRIAADISVSRSESITGRTGKSRGLIESADEQFEQGAFREAEVLLRSARSKADSVERHWGDAEKAIERASEAIGKERGHMIDTIRKSLDAATAAMVDDDPKAAIAIASTIPEQMSEVGTNIEIATQSISEAKRAISASDSSASDEIFKRIEDAMIALERGDASMARGLADGITREVKQASDASSTVQRALRQRSSIEKRLPSGQSRSEWLARLDSVSSLAREDNWIGASDTLSNLIKDLEKFESERKEALEMLNFLNKDWTLLRARLDSTGIPPNNPTRMKAEKSLAEAEGEIENGNLKSALGHIGLADESMEALRRMA